jgi:hypothetical protein
VKAKGPNAPRARAHTGERVFRQGRRRRLSIRSGDGNDAERATRIIKHGLGGDAQCASFISNPDEGHTRLWQRRLLVDHDGNGAAPYRVRDVGTSIVFRSRARHEQSASAHKP